MENALSPREIQTRIRAGATVEQVAHETGMPAEQIEPFATPVLAERQHQVSTALTSPVRRRGETGSNRTLEAVVDERLRIRGLRVDDVEWDAWRTEDRLWVVVGHYEVDGDDAGASRSSAPERTHFEPQWRFDPRARYSTALNDDARWLIGELPPVGVPLRRRGGMDPDSEPTVDLNDEMALIRATQDAAEMTIPLPASIRQHALDPQNHAGQSVAHPADATLPPNGPTEVVVTEVQYVQETIIGVPQPGPASDAQQSLLQSDQDAATGAVQPSSGQLLDAASGNGRTADEGPAVEGPAVEGTAVEGTAEGQVDNRYDAEVFGGEEYVDTELEQVNGVYDFVPSHTGNLDTLYEMLSGFQEDSVNIYAGLDQLPPMGLDDQHVAAEEPPHQDTLADDQAEDDGRGWTAEASETGSAGADAGASQPGVASVSEATAASEAQATSMTPMNREAPATSSQRDAASETHQGSATGLGSEAALGSSPVESESQPVEPDAESAPVATGWPATMGQEREPETNLENPVDRRASTDPVAADAQEAATEPTTAATPQPAPVHEDAAPAPAAPVDQGTSATETPDNKPATDDPVATTNHATGSGEPEQDALVEEPTGAIKPKPKARKRASVPTWDEIMFGGPR